MDITVESLEAAANAELRKLPAVSVSREAGKFYISASLDAAFQSAEVQSENMKDSFVSVEHLFLGLLETAEGAVKLLFDTYRISKEGALKALQTIRGNQRVTTDSPEGTYEALENTAPTWSNGQSPEKWTPSSAGMRRSATSSVRSPVRRPSSA